MQRDRFTGHSWPTDVRRLGQQLSFGRRFGGSGPLKPSGFRVPPARTEHAAIVRRQRQCAI